MDPSVATTQENPVNENQEENQQEQTAQEGEQDIHPQSQFGRSISQDGQNEDYLRYRVDHVQYKSEKVHDETFAIREDTNDHLGRLFQLKRNNEDLKKQYEELNNRIAGLKKLSKKKGQNAKVLDHQISEMESRLEMEHLREEERNKEKERQKHTQSQQTLPKIKPGYVSTEILRLKRKLDHEIIMDGIRNEKRKKFMKTKEEQMSQKELIEKRKEELKEENKKKMLEVQYKVKVSKLSMERYREKISEMTNFRVKQERWEHARLKKLAENRINKLKEITEKEAQRYEQSKIDEENKKKSYEELLDRNYEEHKHKIEAIQNQSKLNKSKLSQSNASNMNQSKLEQSQQLDGDGQNKSQEGKSDHETSPAVGSKRSPNSKKSKSQFKPRSKQELEPLLWRRKEESRG